MKPASEVIIYEGGEARVEVRLERDNVWLSLQPLAELFGRDKSVISRHLRNIFTSSELEREATVAKNATVQQEGGRAVVREIEYYTLALLVAESDARNKDVMIRLIENMLAVPASEGG